MMHKKCCCLQAKLLEIDWPHQRMGYQFIGRGRRCSGFFPATQQEKYNGQKRVGESVKRILRCIALQLFHDLRRFSKRQKPSNDLIATRTDTVLDDVGKWGFDERLDNVSPIVCITWHILVTIRGTFAGMVFNLCNSAWNPIVQIMPPYLKWKIWTWLKANEG